jgi:hypothetical protein
MATAGMTGFHAAIVANASAGRGGRSKPKAGAGKCFSASSGLHRHFIGRKTVPYRFAVMSGKAALA